MGRCFDASPETAKQLQPSGSTTRKWRGWSNAPPSQPGFVATCPKAIVQRNFPVIPCAPVLPHRLRSTSVTFKSSLAIRRPK